eukprot:2689905-Prymnesium_polylepis.1
MAVGPPASRHVRGRTASVVVWRSVRTRCTASMSAMCGAPRRPRRRAGAYKPRLDGCGADGAAMLRHCAVAGVGPVWR